MLKAGVPFAETMEAFRMMEAPSLRSDKAFCTVNSLDVDSERFIEIPLRPSWLVS
jgi:hypothetical protein